MRIHAESALGAARPPRSSGPRPASPGGGRDARCRTARRLRSGDGGRAPDRRGDRSPRERLRGAGSVRSSGGRPRVTPRGGTARPRRQRGDAAGRRGRPDGVVSRCVVRPRRWWTTASVPLHSLGNRPSPSAPGGGGPRDDARGGLVRGPTPSVVSTRDLDERLRRRILPLRVRTRGPGGTLSALEVTRDGDPADRTVDAILAKTTGKRSVVRGSDRDGNEDLTAATVRNSGRGTDRDADRDANRASDRRSDERSTAQEGAQ